jgi:hypothetical protein
MTDNVTIRIGANASQAIREIGRVKKEAGGLGKGLMSWRSGLGIAGGMFGVNAIVEIMRPVKEGFLESAKQSEEFVAVLALINEGLKEFGRLIASVVVPVFEKLSKWLAPIVGLVSGPIARAAFEAGFADFKAGMTPQLLSGSQYTSPTSDQFANDRLKAEEKQTEYQRRMTESLEEMNRDTKKTQLLDPW